MRMRNFQLERFFARHEFSARHLLCCSDCEAMSIGDLLQMEEGALDRFQEQWLGYTEAPGGLELRREIAGLYQNIHEDQILVHSGAEEAIFTFMNSVLHKGDHVIVESPCYQSLFEIADAIGCETSHWMLRVAEGKWRLDFDQLRSSIKENTRLIVINSPHNPTGHILSHQQLNEIIDVCREKNILLFSDEVYKYLEYGEEGTLPWACELYENAVSLGVMSKSLGLPGLRIGWIATRNEKIRKQVASFKDYTSICNSAPSEFLAAVALRNRQLILQRNRSIIAKNLAELEAFMHRYDSLFTWNAPEGGPIAFPGFRAGTDSEPFCEELIHEKGILLLPGKYYEFDPRFFRIGFGRANFLEVLKILEEYLEKKR